MNEPIVSDTNLPADSAKAPDMLQSGLLVAVMLFVGVLGWRMTLGPALAVDVTPLESVPLEIGRWKSSPIPMDATVESVLRADFNLQRAYAASFEEPVWLYVGYYSTVRGGRPEHTPRGCYTGAGWGIEASRTVEIDPKSRLRATEYLIEQNGEQRLVQFWYRSHRRTGILGGLDQNIDRLLGRLFDGRADGALIRISTPITQHDTTAARSRLFAFAVSLDPVLATHWPTEVPCAASPPNGCRTHRSDAL